MIFAEEKILWDFGIIIEPPIELSNPNKINHKSVRNLNQQKQIEQNALISNSFIAPKKIIQSDFIDDNPININQININQIELIISKLFFKKEYNKIIKILKNINYNHLEQLKIDNLNYWLANAFYYSRNNDSAKKIIFLNNNYLNQVRFLFLLAMIYEQNNNYNKALETYQKILTQFPNSDYIKCAQIKLNIINKN